MKEKRSSQGRLAKLLAEIISFVRITPTILNHFCKTTATKTLTDLRLCPRPGNIETYLLGSGMWGWMEHIHFLCVWWHFEHLGYFFTVDWKQESLLENKVFCLCPRPSSRRYPNNQSVQTLKGKKAKRSPQSHTASLNSYVGQEGSERSSQGRAQKDTERRKRARSTYMSYVHVFPCPQWRPSHFLNDGK